MITWQEASVSVLAQEHAMPSEKMKYVACAASADEHATSLSAEAPVFAPSSQVDHLVCSMFAALARYSINGQPLLGSERLSASCEPFRDALRRSVHDSGPTQSFIATRSAAPHGSHEALMCSATTQESALDDADIAKPQRYVPCAIACGRVKG